MTVDGKILKGVKDALGITDTFMDNALRIHIGEVMEYMIDAGVPEDVVKSEKAIGVLSRGVSDLWNFGNANGKLSEYFVQRVCQMRHQSEV